jgi:hypothetical protein
MGAKAIQQPFAGPWQIPVPDTAFFFRQRQAGKLQAGVWIKKAKLDLLRMGGIDGKIGAFVHQRRAKRKRLTRIKLEAVEPFSFFDHANHRDKVIVWDPLTPSSMIDEWRFFCYTLRQSLECAELVALNLALWKRRADSGVLRVCGLQKRPCQVKVKAKRGKI